MEQRELNKIASRHFADEKKLKKAVMAFVWGGMISILGQLFNDLLLHYFSQENAALLTILFFIFLAALLTGFGFYDKMAKYAGAGLFIPITGFSNALTSSAMECRKEGPIYGIGNNMFKLAGSVITYGVVSAMIVGLIVYGVHLL